MAEMVSALYNGHTDFDPHILSREDVTQAGARNPADTFNTSIGAANRLLTERELNENGLAYVDMNSNGFVKIESGNEGAVATSSLSGCTGVAAFAELPDGQQTAMVAHYDAISQTHHFTRADSPINKLPYTFRHEVGKETPIQVVVTYPEVVRHDVDLGNKESVFDEWHYLDQITTTASHLGEKVQVLFVPYRESAFELATYLGAGKHKGTSGIFYNGALVDFYRRFNQGFDHDRWLNPPTPPYETSWLEAARIRGALMNDWHALAL